MKKTNSKIINKYSINTGKGQNTACVFDVYHSPGDHLIKMHKSGSLDGYTISIEELEYITNELNKALKDIKSNASFYSDSLGFLWDVEPGDDIDALPCPREVIEKLTEDVRTMFVSATAEGIKYRTAIDVAGQRVNVRFLVPLDNMLKVTHPLVEVVPASDMLQFITGYTASY